MELGSWLARLADENNAAEAIEALGNIALFAEVEIMGRQHDEAPGEYVASAAGRFAARASDEDWLALMNAVERNPDPARALLERILRWALVQDRAAMVPAPAHEGCTCGGHGGCHDHA